LQLITSSVPKRNLLDRFKLNKIAVLGTGAGFFRNNGMENEVQILKFPEKNGQFLRELGREKGNDL
jgi:hypothetical protein